MSGELNGNDTSAQAAVSAGSVLEGAAFADEGEQHNESMKTLVLVRLASSMAISAPARYMLSAKLFMRRQRMESWPAAIFSASFRSSSGR